MGYLDQLQAKPRDPILGLSTLFQLDTNPNKLNLGIGAYKTEDGQVALFKSVHQAESSIWDEKRSKSYAPIDGDKVFREEVLKLIYGEYNPKVQYCAQTTGCTAALRVSGELLREMGITTIYLPDSTWQNHYLLYSQAGLKTEQYPYYDTEKNALKLSEIIETLKDAPENSAVLFQVSCHNPVGRDPSKEDWDLISSLILEKNLFPILDCAYQGFGQGLEEDIYPIHLYYAKFQQYFLCYSFSKNFGLYGERTGAFIAIDHTTKAIDQVATNTRHYIRAMYSSPPIHGARIVKTILQSEELRKVWEEELYAMQMRLKSLRRHFVEELKAQGINKDYGYIEDDQGLFSLLGLSKDQVMKLRDEYGIYMVENGRVNIAALSLKKMSYLAESIKHLI